VTLGLPSRAGGLLGAATIAVVAAVSVGCGPALPTIPQPAGTACRGIGLDAVLHGDPADPRLAWLTTADRRRIDVVWPAGYRATFRAVGDQRVLEVLDASGTYVIGESDVVHGGCTTPDARVVLLEPPF
jgi:hypothetical protein